MIVIEGIPLFYLELAVGQRLRKGAVGSWNQVCTTMTRFHIYNNYSEAPMGWRSVFPCSSSVDLFVN